MDWTDAAIAKLRTLWARGLTIADIGRALDCSKNAVVGKARRLDLTARPSPIITEDNKPAFEWTEARLARVKTLHGVGYSDAQIARDLDCKQTAVRTQRRRLGLVGIMPVARMSNAPRRQGAGSIRTTLVLGAIQAEPARPITYSSLGCQFPMWPNRQRPTHIYCAEAIPVGRVYCPCHEAICYAPSAAHEPADAVPVGVIGSFHSRHSEGKSSW